MTIYFIRAVDCGRIKIGFTESGTPAGRLSAMQVGCPSPLEVITHCEGTEERESELHKLLRQARVRGEWFRPTKKLASLLAYVAKTATTYGWEEAEEDPESFAAFFAKHKTAKRPTWQGLDESEITWRLALERLERMLPRPTSERALPADYFWERGDPLEYTETVEHTVQDLGYIDNQIGWRSATGRLQCTVAEELTASLLANAKNKTEEGAIWIGACVHTLTNDRHGNIYSARERVPGLEAVELAIRDLLPETWNSRSARPLPLHFTLPQRCLLTVEEFCLVVGRHRQATLAQYTPYAAWRHGYCCDLPTQREEAA